MVEVKQSVKNNLKGNMKLLSCYSAVWSLESEMSKERSEHIRFLEPHCHSALSRKP